jgi:hypothetical protein
MGADALLARIQAEPLQQLLADVVLTPRSSLDGRAVSQGLSRHVQRLAADVQRAARDVRRAHPHLAATLAEALQHSTRP